MVSSQDVCNKILYTKSRACGTANVKCRNRETKRRWPDVVPPELFKLFDPDSITRTVTDHVRSDGTFKQRKKISLSTNAKGSLGSDSSLTTGH